MGKYFEHWQLKWKAVRQNRYLHLSIKCWKQKKIPKMQFSYLRFKHPNQCKHFTYFGWTFMVNFFSGVYHPQFDCESSSEVRKMLGCLNHKYESCISICQHLPNKIPIYTPHRNLTVRMWCWLYYFFEPKKGKNCHIFRHRRPKCFCVLGSDIVRPDLHAKIQFCT